MPPKLFQIDMQIKTLDELEHAVFLMRSVLVWNSDKPMPAAFVMSMPASVVHRMLKQGVMLYEPKN